MAHRLLVLLALTGLASPVLLAAPASELSGRLPVLPAHAPVTVDAFLQRVRAPVAATPPASPSAGYVPRTAHDNSPYRFDMTQNGRRMTAEEFAAWMKARGIRVATGRPSGGAAAASVPAAAATAQACQPTTATTC